MQSASDTLSNIDKATLLMATVYLKDILFRILSHVCHINALGLTQELADKLMGIKKSPNWTENTNINKWTLEIKQAAQLLIDQAKELNPDNVLFKVDQSASGKDHEKVLCIWKLCFATYLVLDLHGYLTILGRPVDGVTFDECYNMFGQIKDIVDPILGVINVSNYEAFFEEYPKANANAVNPSHVVQKIHECIASEPVDITGSVKAITFDVDGEAVNLVNCINNLGSLFCPK
ncbi:hypothetical protein H4219_003636 [Mycoemilia scoparia]|uniref:Uncharacterized protein n=1 Tax=Mycoemilia scoparia TaxID=417184 RepID=A0A9W8DSC8_9FUNG|nr:hypothetical protein H4219_003636 [Mycoemilia scoparia]